MWNSGGTERPGCEVNGEQGGRCYSMKNERSEIRGGAEGRGDAVFYFSVGNTLGIYVQEG